jgi:hypothetical protein
MGMQAKVLDLRTIQGLEFFEVKLSSASPSLSSKLKVWAAFAISLPFLILGLRKGRMTKSGI